MRFEYLEQHPMASHKVPELENSDDSAKSSKQQSLLFTLPSKQPSFEESIFDISRFLYLLQSYVNQHHADDSQIRCRSYADEP